MLIAVVGPRYSGKSAIENYLVSNKGFVSLRLNNGPSENGSTETDFEDNKLRSTWTHSSDPQNDYQSHFSTPLSRAASKHLSFLSLSPLTSHVPWAEDSPEPLSFPSPAAMLDYVTVNWKDNFVTMDLCTRDLVEKFIRRPFFMLISVDAPVLVRYSRSQSLEAESLEGFLRENDELTFGHTTDGRDGPSSLRSFQDLVDIHINNNFNELSELYTHLEGLNLLDPQHLRPSWDAYFMTLASLASRRSNCMKRRVGAVLVRDNRILATGYNGTPRGLKNCHEGGCGRCNGSSTTFSRPEECVCLHAEENALLEAGRERVGANAVLYCNTCPCLKCTVKIIQTGIKTVVYNLSYKVDDTSALLFEQAGVKLRRFDPNQRLRLSTADDNLATRTLLLSPAPGPNQTVADR
ncbi:Deoxycytidylate deaminase [Leucoagaricus sp. SymC.cos]|nr:Deoxycytidylate deaminase [Leucoagaricus sp. SymC.cos]